VVPQKKRDSLFFVSTFSPRVTTSYKFWRNLYLVMESIFTNAQYVTLQKKTLNISHIHILVTITFSPTPPIKLKLGLQVGGRLLNSNPLWPVNAIKNRELSINTIWLCLLGPLYTRSQGQCSTHIQHSYCCKSWNQPQGLLH
jgi:hypothetical protein